jgi:uncharacterized protein YndB with AHSA1/START domain
VNDRVELQTEVAVARDLVFPLFATADGLRRWLDAADLDARVGGKLRVTMRDAQAVGRVIALDPPQHISFEWDWVDRPLGRPSVVAFDVIDHGERTWVTVRQVGLPMPEQVRVHEEMWRYWLRRFEEACEQLTAPANAVVR